MPAEDVACGLKCIQHHAADALDTLYAKVAVGPIDRAIQQNAAATKEATGAARSLSSEANRLVELVAKPRPDAI